MIRNISIRFAQRLTLFRTASSSSNSTNNNASDNSNQERQTGFDGVERWSTKKFFREAQSAPPVSSATFSSVAELACLEVHESDEQLRHDLGQMIAYVKVIQNVVGDQQRQIEPLVSVAPSTLRRPSISSAIYNNNNNTSSSSSTNASRIDTSHSTSAAESTVLSRDELLRQSKSTKENYYVVPAPSSRDD